MQLSSVYITYTITYSEEEKQAFYQEQVQVVDSVTAADKLLLVGYFKARAGKDYTTYEGVIGKFGKSRKNANNRHS